MDANSKGMNVSTSSGFQYDSSNEESQIGYAEGRKKKKSTKSPRSRLLKRAGTQSKVKEEHQVQNAIVIMFRSNNHSIKPSLIPFIENFIHLSSSDSLYSSSSSSSSISSISWYHGLCSFIKHGSGIIYFLFLPSSLLFPPSLPLSISLFLFLFLPPSLPSSSSFLPPFPLPLPSSLPSSSFHFPLPLSLPSSLPSSFHSSLPSPFLYCLFSSPSLPSLLVTNW